ncbi:MAG: malto-oligosyltrehalose trehalohydrolase [Xanthobacteraceae bacterium]|uniref:malto-oligosyltrehalose trehalohydrolase n=1 Tax=Pseudolabrys sp. TaxID=1960880 RepID=UPI003D0DF08A
MTAAFGPRLTAEGVEFRLWAPAAKIVDLVIGDEVMPMAGDGHGWFARDVPGAGGGTKYRLRVDDELTIPDPASRFQPHDVSGPSQVVDHKAYRWRSSGWRGRPWHEASVLELHVGAFTQAGTFRAAIETLDHVAATGLTAIELMPLADFPGRWNWGYDGVLWFAPDSVYGTPDDLKALIDAAHGRGLMVFLDVVYNHFGPEGNYLPRIAPQFFSKAQTPWGVAIDYALPEARAFAVENAVAWVRDYRFDGLRLDAVHAIATPGEPDILHEISAMVGDVARESGRYIHLILENDDNAARLLAPDENPPRGRYRAQWNDDYHHAWHVWLTGESTGYYKDYTAPEPLIARTLAEGFVYQGEPSKHRNGAPRGEPSRVLPPLAFVDFLQNHDQIGNRALGERLAARVPPSQLEAALIVLLLSPAVPMLFMGDEWGSRRPFPFFCDFTGDLADAVRNGRKAEFAEAYADPALDVPDPLAQHTFRSAVLDWGAADGAEGRRRLQLVTALLRARQRHIVPLLPEIEPERSDASFTDGVLRARWQTASRALHMVADFTGADRDEVACETQVWDERRPDDALPWSVTVGIGPMS